MTEFLSVLKPLLRLILKIILVSSLTWSLRKVEMIRIVDRSVDFPVLACGS